VLISTVWKVHSLCYYCDVGQVAAECLKTWNVMYVFSSLLVSLYDGLFLCSSLFFSVLMYVSERHVLLLNLERSLLRSCMRSVGLAPCPEKKLFAGVVSILVRDCYFFLTSGKVTRDIKSISLSLTRGRCFLVIAGEQAECATL
jgi:hypothetical protein